MFTLRRPLIRLTTPAALALLISGASLMVMPSANAGGFQRIDRPVYQSRPVHIRHSRTVQCQINNPSMYCYHSRGDFDLASRNMRWFPVSFKFIHYSMRAYTQIHNNNQVKVTVRYGSYEGGGDHTTFWSTRSYIVYTAPRGYRISSAQGPSGYGNYARSGKHSGWTLNAPSCMTRPLDCTAIKIRGDKVGNDLYQGYNMYFPVKVDLVPTG